ncbi:MAG: hypothetical protein IH987_14865 [Planctomycetes bacterium]|nr:hypothetical protein [Planctomycetota bacterium]
MAKKSAQKVRRPYGEKLTRAVRVRLPVELDSALRQVRRLFGVSVAHQIRTGIECSLGNMVPKAVAMLRDENTSTSMKLKLMKFLYSVAKANLAQHHPEQAKILREGLREFYRQRRRKPPSRRKPDDTEESRSRLEHRDARVQKHEPAQKAEGAVGKQGTKSDFFATWERERAARERAMSVVSTE